MTNYILLYHNIIIFHILHYYHKICYSKVDEENGHPVLVPALFAPDLPYEMIERDEVESQSGDKHDAVHCYRQYLSRQSNQGNKYFGKFGKILLKTTYLGFSEFHIIWEGEVFFDSCITSFMNKLN